MTLLMLCKPVCGALPGRSPPVHRRHSHSRRARAAAALPRHLARAAMGSLPSRPHNSRQRWTAAAGGAEQDRASRRVLARALASTPSPTPARAAAPGVSAAPAAAPLHQPDCEALIVGAGPAGLGAALLLAQHGFQHIHVLDKTRGPAFEKPELSYCYSIDGRGQRFLRQAGLLEALASRAVRADSILFNRVTAEGELKQVSMDAMKDPGRPTFWLPRRSFLELLAEAAAQQPQITIHYATACTSISKALDDSSSSSSSGSEGGGGDGQPPGLMATEHLMVRALKRQQAADGGSGGTDQELLFRPRLLVGADGINSMVRAQLQAWDEADKGSAASASHAAEGAGNRFDITALDSESAGLRFKVLRLPPNPEVSKAGGKAEIRLPNADFAVVQSGLKQPLRAIRLGMLPMPDPTAPRTANVIAKPEHQFWRVNTAQQLYEYFEEAFPHLPVRELVPLEEAERFAASPGGAFPRPQYCHAFTWVAPPPAAVAATPSGAAGLGGPSVLLLGDAIHAFPPDMGQGVNAALEDLTVLDSALAAAASTLQRATGQQQATGSDSAAERSLLTAIALPAFERKRKADVVALVHMAVFAFPQQYGQDPAKRTLWFANAALRMALNKLLPGFISPPAFRMLQDAGLSYSTIVDRAHATTARLQAMAAALAALAVALLLKANGVW